MRIRGFGLPRRAADRKVAFGSNLVGVVVGGLLECASFVIGVRNLLLVALAAYVASWLALGKTARLETLTAEAAAGQSVER